MKVLWVSNIIFPEVCNELHMTPPVVGGWMYASALALLENNPHLDLAVASLYSGKELKIVTNYKIQYYLIPQIKGNQCYNKEWEQYFKQIEEHFTPDIIHIHGSEYPHSLACAKACNTKNIVISIQGMVSICAQYYLGGISAREIQKTKTFRDIIRKDSLLTQQNKMYLRGEYEKQLLHIVNHVIGRTSWDRSNVWAISPNLTYHFCNEILRPTFYHKKWEYHTCQKHTIFLSQAHYPLKGLQQVIKALPIILQHYPDTQIYVAGNNFISTSLLRKNGFANYIQRLIKAYHVENTIHFLGILSEEEMAEQYTKAHVFICPSAIENSPNSVGEAQLIGTPCIASYTGGIMDMITDNETGFLYRYEEIALLAQRVCELFENSKLCEKLMKNEREIAMLRHNKEINAQNLNNIYQSILKQ